MSHVFGRAEPAIEQHAVKFELIAQAGIQHRAHLLVLGHIADASYLAGLEVTELNIFAHQLKSDR